MDVVVVVVLFTQATRDLDFASNFSDAETLPAPDRTHQEPRYNAAFSPSNTVRRE